MAHTITVDEEQRQLILMALANLAFNKPGFNCALAEIAKKMDIVNASGQPEMYEQFKKLAA